MLKRQGAKTNIDPEAWRKKEIITSCIKKVGTRSFKMLERVFRQYVSGRDQSKGGGFFRLSMIIGFDAEVCVKDVKNIWNRMISLYGEDDLGVQAINKTLGTLLMIIIAEDDKRWVWEPDPDKTIRILMGEKPDGNYYYKDFRLTC